MQSQAGRDRSGEGAGVVAEMEAPPMPVISAGEIHRHPQLVSWDGRYSVGWQNARKEGQIFVVVQISAITSSPKVVERFPLTEDGWARAWATLVKLDIAAAEAVRKVLDEGAARAAARAAERERQARVYEAVVGAGASRSVFAALGVQVLADSAEVYTVGSHDPAARADSSRLLGPLAGAEATVTDGSQAWSPGRAMFLPIGIAGLATKTMAHAVVIFADGAVHTTELDGNNAVRQAQLQVVQFNALAGTSAPRATEAGSDPAAKLRKLKELLDEGLLDQDEYEAKRAEVIRSI